MLELAIALNLYGDNFLRNIRKATEETDVLKATAAALKNENSFNILAEEVKKTSKEAETAEGEFKSLSKTIKKAFDPKNLDSFSEKLEDITVKAGTIGGAITLGFKSVVGDAAEFEKGLAEASTLVKADFEKFKELYSNQLLDISVKLGQEKTAVTKAFYDAISSGFKPEEALKIISQAGKAAVAGVSDISTANNTLITVMKAWGLPLKESSDLIFKTIAKGRTTFTEIARNIGGVAAIISSAGIKFREFSAVVAAATAKGLDTGQTMTSIREIVNSLIAPTTQAEKAFKKLGITVNKETLKQKGLVGTLREITEAMKRAGLSEAEQAQMISQIFGSVEAQKVVNMFIADPKSFTETLKEFQKTGGETEEAFKKMSQSTAFAFNRLSEAISSTKIVFGALFLPVVEKGADILSGFAISVKNLIDNHKTLASVIGGTVGAFGVLASATAAVAALGAFSAKAIALSVEGVKFYGTAGKFLFNTFKAGIPVIRTFSTLVASNFASALRVGISLLRTFTTALISNPLILAALAVAAAGFLIYKNWDRIKPVLLDVWKAVKGFFSGIGELIGRAGKIGSAVLNAFKGFGKGIATLISKAVNFGKSAVVSLAKAIILYSPLGIFIREWQKVFGFLSSINLFKAGSKIINTLIEGVKSKAKALYESVKGTLSKVRNLLPFSPAKEGPLSDLHKTGLRFVETITEGIKGDSLLKKVSSVLTEAKSLFLSIGIPKLPVPTLPPIIQRVKTLIEALPTGKFSIPTLPPIVQRVKPLIENRNLLLKSLATATVFTLTLPSLKVPVEKPLSVSSLTERKVSTNTNYHIHLSITVNGKADRQTAVEIAKAVEPVIRKVLREQQRKEARTNYGIGDSYNFS